MKEIKGREQKSKNKLPVGANFVRTGNKGITLIALIITIIIMLILVAVTVNYSIKSGLLEKAKEGKNNYQYQEEEDKIGQIRLDYKIDKEVYNSSLGLYTYLKAELSGEAEVTELTGEDAGKIKIKYNKTGNEHIIPNENINIKEKPIIMLYEDDRLIIYGNDGSDKQYLNSVLDSLFAFNGADYSTWSKSQNESSITYFGTVHNGAEDFDFDVSIIFYPNIIVDKSFINTLINGESEWCYVEIGSEYMYTFNSEMNGWHVGVIDYDKETFTEKFKNEICGYPISDFQYTFADCSNLIAVPKIPMTAKNITGIFHHSNKISEASYEGTIEQYKQIEGYDHLYSQDWREGFTIHCSDGDFQIKKEE